MAEKKDQPKVVGAEDVAPGTLRPSADSLRADHDPTTDPHHTRGIDPAVADAAFRAHGYPKGPLAGKRDSLAAGGRDVAVAPESGLPNPTADSADVPEGGIVREGQIIDEAGKTADEAKG